MSHPRPLKILTLDGGGLQALAALSSLNAVCKAIAKQNGAARPPAPHELFDIIGGVGTGGWIALLLGRYRLDVATCTAVYMEIATRVDFATSNPNSRRNRPFKLDQDRLIAVVEETLQRYDLNSGLLPQGGRTSRPRGQSSRCKYAFAAGVVQHQNKQPATYELFRSYRLEESAKDKVLPGPKPSECRVPEVFAATGAAKFFLKPYKIGNMGFFDETFPQSHPISLLALNEALALYGQNGQQVDISVLLNIGPGIPTKKDFEELDMMSLGPMRRLTRKFSWPMSSRLSLKPKLFFFGGEETAEGDTKLTSPSESALRLESQRRLDVRTRLQDLFGETGAEKYHHLGPDYSVEKASLNDVHAIRLPRPNSDALRQQSIAEAEGVVRQFWVDPVA